MNKGGQSYFWVGEGVGQIQKKKDSCTEKSYIVARRKKNKLQASAMKFIGAEICLRHIQIQKFGRKTCRIWDQLCNQQ